MGASKGFELSPVAHLKRGFQTLGPSLNLEKRDYTLGFAGMWIKAFSGLGVKASGILGVERSDW